MNHKVMMAQENFDNSYITWVHLILTHYLFYKGWYRFNKNISLEIKAWTKNTPENSNSKGFLALLLMWSCYCIQLQDRLNLCSPGLVLPCL